MSGTRSRNKGARGERYFCQAMTDAGLPTHRVPLSGAMANYKNDVIVKLSNEASLEGEVKVRAKGFTFLYQNLNPHTQEVPPDFLAIKQDHKDFLIVLRLEDYAKLLKQGADYEQVTQEQEQTQRNQ